MSIKGQLSMGEIYVKCLVLTGVAVLYDRNDTACKKDKLKDSELK